MSDADQNTLIYPENRGDSFFQQLQAWFLDYIDQFEGSTDDHQRYQSELKRQHTLRVVQEITTLGTILQIDAHEMLISRIIALFHDIGRFEQLLNYGTFNDYNSFDHGLLGRRIIAGLSCSPHRCPIHQEFHSCLRCFANSSRKRFPLKSDKQRFVTSLLGIC